MTHTHLEPDEDGEYALTFYCGELPSDPAVQAVGMEPNGHFWETVAAHVAPDVIDAVELDSEGSMFAAYGAVEDLRQLQDALTPLIESPEAMGRLLAEARDALSD